MTIAAGERTEPASATVPAHVILEGSGERCRLRTLAGDRVVDDRTLPVGRLAAEAPELERHGPRWIWDPAAVSPALLAAGVRVERSHDLRLARAILRRAAGTASSYGDVPTDAWDDAPGEPGGAPVALFGLEPDAEATDALV